MAFIARLFALAAVSLPVVQPAEPGFVRWSAAELQQRDSAYVLVRVPAVPSSG